MRLTSDQKLLAISGVENILTILGEDYLREGLRDTPERVVKSWQRIYGGYDQDPKDLITVFSPESYNQMVLLKNIEFYSMCEHHMLPFFGKAHIAYIPSEKHLLGVSKLSRLLEIYSRRLQIQERIGEQITSFLMNEVHAQGAACILDAQHLCMTMRGVEKKNAQLVTSSVRGLFESQVATRQEFLTLIGLP